MASVRDTFPDCETHVMWIRLGSEDAVRVLPNFRPVLRQGLEGLEDRVSALIIESLDDEALRRIAMYERVRFGGGELESERSACGLG